MSECVCGSGKVYSQCCQPLHQGMSAPHPEALMRSRYSAFVLKNEAYIRSSWHASTCPADLTLDDTQWLSLVVHSSSETNSAGLVSFTARFKDGKEWHELREESRFVKDSDGFWRYLDGNAVFEVLKPGRNDECVCGSGLKFKKCCA